VIVVVVIVVVIVIMIVIVVVVVIVIMVVVVGAIDDDDVTLVTVPGLAIATIAMLAEARTHGHHIRGGDKQTCNAHHRVT
jgi:hypothetical protein